MEKKSDSKFSAKHEYTKLIVVLAILFAIIISLILYFSWPLLTGTTIVLQPQPVDPFDIFRGQYMALNYDISSVPAPAGASQGDKVYVTLEENKSSGIWHYKGASLSKPSGGIFIKGSIQSVYGDNMRVEYGIETYFFERNAQIPQQNMTVEVMVSKSGGARIVQLLQNGRPIEIKYADSGIYS